MLCCKLKRIQPREPLMPTLQSSQLCELHLICHIISTIQGFFFVATWILSHSTQFSLKVYAISARAGIPDDPNEVQLSQWLIKQLENLQAFSQPRKTIVFAESKLWISNVCISVNTSTWAEILEEQLERCSTPWRGNVSLDDQKVRRAMYAKE